MQDSTEQMVASASRGDTAAVAELLERNLPRLRAFVRLRMGEQLRAQESASDLVQSACREVLQHMDRYQYRSEARFRHWLFTTALRKIRDRVDYWRAGKRDVQRQVAIPGTHGEELLADVYADFVTPSADLDMRERIARLEAAFDRLPEDYREVITLTRIVGMPHGEVAAAMGRSEAASRMLLYRALAQLAVELDGPR
jgi:RNA polymerase sigma-70 factor (ECF subfamily)